jgi:hypothetical protein
MKVSTGRDLAISFIRREKKKIIIIIKMAVDGTAVNCSCATTGPCSRVLSCKTFNYSQKKKLHQPMYFQVT